MSAVRENWVDAVKGLAILLVAVCHGMQGLFLARLLPFHVVWWGIVTSIYCFHIPLFLLCSGYLWQQYGRGTGWCGHLRASSEKAWRLGVPYVVFATFSWSLKTICARSVNRPPDGLWHDLVVAPAAPYWFLPALILLFFLFPRMRGAADWVALFSAAVAAEAAFAAWSGKGWCFPAQVVARYAFWFTAGMGCAWGGTEFFQRPAGRRLAAACALLFLVGAVAACANGLWWHPTWWSCKAVKWGLGVLACPVVLAWALDHRGGGLLEWLGRRPLPIFLMHTVFAAAVRIGLVSLGVRTLWVHIPAMLAASFAGPLCAMHILEWMRLDGLVYPHRFHGARIGLSKDGPRG